MPVKMLSKPSERLIDRLRQCLIMAKPTIRHDGRTHYDVRHQNKGHDCPAEPRFNSVFATWYCEMCDWTHEIGEHECLICGLGERDSPVIDSSEDLREQFINFNHPKTGHVFGLHSSCAIYGVVESVLDMNPVDDNSDDEPELA